MQRTPFILQVHRHTHTNAMLVKAKPPHKPGHRVGQSRADEAVKESIAAFPASVETVTPASKAGGPRDGSWVTMTKGGVLQGDSLEPHLFFEVPPRRRGRSGKAKSRGAGGAGGARLYHPPPPVDAFASGIKRKMRCGLCEMKFDTDHLPNTICWKSILQQRERFAARRLGLTAEESLASRMHESHFRKIPHSHLYSAKKICQFCSQFFDLGLSTPSPASSSSTSSRGGGVGGGGGGGAGGGGAGRGDSIVRDAAAESGGGASGGGDELSLSSAPGITITTVTGRWKVDRPVIVPPSMPPPRKGAKGNEHDGEGSKGRKGGKKGRVRQPQQKQPQQKQQPHKPEQRRAGRNGGVVGDGQAGRPAPRAHPSPRHKAIGAASAAGGRPNGTGSGGRGRPSRGGNGSRGKTGRTKGQGGARSGAAPGDATVPGAPSPSTSLPLPLTNNSGSAAGSGKGAPRIRLASTERAKGIYDT